MLINAGMMMYAYWNETFLILLRYKISTALLEKFFQIFFLGYFVLDRIIY